MLKYSVTNKEFTKTLGLGDVPLIAPFKLSWFMQYKIIPVKSSI
jgi:hypothetical protein